jgi:hypothetical protein
MGRNSIETIISSEETSLDLQNRNCDTDNVDYLRCKPVKRVSDMQKGY